MLRADNDVLWNDPLQPLTEKQLQAAADSHEYARANDLVLALETNDHLQYHYGVAADEQRRIPAAERSLADDHLPPLVLQPTKIEELWIVPRRVAGVLEAACRWLTEEELKACEVAVVSNESKTVRSAAEQARTLKLETPLLLTDPDEDYAELQRITTATLNCGEGCARSQGLVQSVQEEQELFTVPAHASAYASRLEEGVRTETMAVSELSIRSLVALMASTEWTDRDQAAFLDKQTPIPSFTSRYVSPPLPPVGDFECYYPQGDACLVSDASDVSSGISEALEEAERLLTKQAGDNWADEGVDLSLPSFSNHTFDDSMTILCSHVPPLDAQSQQESELSISLSPSPKELSQQNAPPYMSAGDELFGAWVNESTVDGEGSVADNVAQRCPDNPLETIQKSSYETRSDDSLQDESYEELTEEALFALEANDIVVQAKVPLPDVEIESSLPDWHGVGADALDMLQWIINDTKAAFQGLYLHGEDSMFLLPHVDLDELSKQYTNVGEETLNADLQSFETATAFMKTVPDVQSMLINSITPVVFLSGFYNDAPLEVLWDKPNESKVPKAFTLPNDSMAPKEDPASPSKSVQGKSSSSPKVSSQIVLKEQSIQKQTPGETGDIWRDLMARHKRRKQEHAQGTCTASNANAPTSQKTVQIKAPELLLGFRAFADPRFELSEQDKSHGACHDGAVQPLSSTKQSSTILIQKGPVIQPIDTGTTRLFKAILSMSIPRTLRTMLVTLLPNLEFVERDYQQIHPGYGGINTSFEADLVVSPSTGLIIITMVDVRQTDSQKRPVFQNRVAVVAPRYEMLHVLIYRNNARPIRNDEADMHDDLPELSPSDAMALAQLHGFLHSLPCKVSASYVGGGEQAVAEWAASLVVQEAKKDGEQQRAIEVEKYLVEEETRWELFLRQACLNVYDAQILFGVLLEATGRQPRDTMDGIHAR
ncbi:hypothetical protein SPBR_06543 [Sporothrix brasiliensis 5110]|uniref:Uncharacterized protein n=1 Tax=Sporothrix brasiliensis 5110 TaxID=1398154 RepID=A0A0C2IUY5_9PEZI|nr:uncharacterized protein SPBR_06543 [Sporothrix brasiliensis 5110]KIH88807.1 hypothetical protein SPBR_06543 [Sporothrix brasiliensis 5110]